MNKCYSFINMIFVCVVGSISLLDDVSTMEYFPEVLLVITEGRIHEATISPSLTLQLITDL